MPRVRYPRAWYLIAAFLSVGLALALMPFWLSKPLPPALGPQSKILLAELQSAFSSAGAAADQLSCRGTKGSTLIACNAQIVSIGTLQAELAAQGWQPQAPSAGTTANLKRGELALVVEQSGRFAYVTVSQRAGR